MSIARSQSTAVEHDEYRFQLELADESGDWVREEPLGRHDFKSAVYAACFERVRQGILAEYSPHIETARIDPVFSDATDRAPYAAGFRIAEGAHGHNDPGMGFSLTYFGSRASRIRSQLVRQEQIPDASQLRYYLSAYLDQCRPHDRSRSPISLDATTFHVPLREKRRAELGDAETWDNPDPADVPVLVARSLLAEAIDESQRAPDREIGGVLLGHVCREPATGEVFVEVTCLVSGEETVQSTQTTVTFTPETWLLARQVINLRGAGEIMVGWYHSHPFRLCQECTLPAPAKCVNKILFYSQDDVQVMETTFDQPYMVGLLAAVDTRLERSLGHAPVRLFGWRKGEIHARGFDVISG